jgi:hypothetical protein
MSMKKQDIETPEKHCVAGEEVTGDEAFGLSAQELGPSRTGPPWRGIESMAT